MTEREYDLEVDYLADWPREDFSTWERVSVPGAVSDDGQWAHDNGWRYPLPLGDAVSVRSPFEHLSRAGAVRAVSEALGRRAAVAEVVDALVQEGLRARNELRQWESERYAAHRAASLEAARHAATNHREQWTQADLDVLFDYSLSRAERRERLGRTDQAMESAQARYGPARARR